MPLLFRFPGILGVVPNVAPPAGPFQPLAVDTNGGTARWTRGGDLTTNADGKTFFFSMWINPDTVVGDGQIYTTPAAEMVIQRMGDRIRLFAENAAGAVILNMQSPIGSVQAGIWQHWCGSFDLANAANRWFRKNAANQTVTAPTYVDDTINFTNTDHAIGANPAGVTAYAGKLGEIWIKQIFVPNLDENVFQFITGAGGSPIDLGASGITTGSPTFGSPIMYFSRRDGVANFATNKGTGGGFTAVGTPLDGGLIIGGQTPPVGSPSSFDATQITSRAPKLYLPLEETVAPLDDAAASNLPVVLNGVPAAFCVVTAKGFGIDLGGTADILVNHSTVFETDHGIARTSAAVTWVYSEVCMIGQFKCNTLATQQYLFGKSGDPAAWQHSLNVYVETNGRLRVDARTPWRHVRLESPNSAVVAGTEFHVCVFLGREGLWATLNGRMLNNGEKDPRHWYGWDHRVRGFRGFNNQAIRIGKSLTGARANIVVSKFAVFVTGVFTNRFDINDAQALAGASGVPLGHPLFDNSTASVGPGTNVLQAAIDARNAAGGGTVVLSAGTYTQNVNLTLKNNVRLKGAGISSTIINLTAGACIGTGDNATGVPTLTSYAFPGPLTIGQNSLTITNTLTDDAILIVVAVTPLFRLFYPTGTLPPQGDEVNVGEFIPVFTRTGTVFTLEGGLNFAYPAGDQQAIRGFNPQLKDCEVTDMRITGNLSTGTQIGVAHFQGARRVFLRRVRVQEAVAHGGDPGKLTNMINIYGCVDVVVENSEWSSTSSFGTYVQTGGSHPYGCQVLGGVNNVIMSSYGHSNDWAATDNGADNYDQQWTGANQPWFVGSNRAEWVDCQGTGAWFHGPWQSHLASQTRLIGCESMNGGGIGSLFVGYREEASNCHTHFPAALGFPSGDLNRPGNQAMPNGRFTPCSFEGYFSNITHESSVASWFAHETPNVSSVFVNISRGGGITGAAPRTQTNCTFVNVQAPLPPNT